MAAAAAVATLGAWPAAVLPDAQTFVSVLAEALRSVERFQAQVEKGRVISNFGKKSQAVVAKAVRDAGDAAPEMEQAVDGALHSVFQQQLALLRQDLFERFRHPGGRLAPEPAAARAETLFAQQAAGLVRPGSSWSFEAEQASFRAALAGELRQADSVLRERRRVAQAQRATADVIGKLQKQMEQMGEKLRGTSAGSPWVLWTSYRLPGTPFQMSARYQEGRTNIELNLTPNKDPANAATGMVEGLTSSNLGLSLNVGM
uniref:Uncharacterized protein n=1 Tax=Zooxanthella nutricula TaxID=1333877 RepID=A0A7S2QFB0_9DINO